jgi:hypothetical protein
MGSNHSPLNPSRQIGPKKLGAARFYQSIPNETLCDVMSTDRERISGEEHAHERVVTTIMEHLIGSSNYIALVRASASLNKDAKTHETIGLSPGRRASSPPK